MKEVLLNYDYIEPLLFSIGVVQILRNRLGAVFVIILFLFEAKFFTGDTQSSFMFPHNYFDVGLLLFIGTMIRLALRKTDLDLLPTKWIRWGVIFFYVFLLVAISVDMIYNEVAPIATLKYFRNWSVLTLVFFVNRIRKPEIDSFLRYYLIISVSFAFVFIFEYLFDLYITGAQIHRGYRASVLSWTIIMVLLLLLMNYYHIGSLTKWCCVIIILVELILSASRSGFIAYVIAGGGALLFASSTSLLRKILLFSMLAMGLIVLFASNNEISKRFDDASQDMESVNTQKGVVVGNFSFRWLLMAERAIYISQEPQRIVFGIGTIQEKDFPTIFSIGYYDNERHRPNQIDTGDNAWAPLMMRLGFVGTGVYICAIFIPFIVLCHNKRKEVYSFCLLIYILVSLVIISFTYNEITSSGFWFMPMILLLTTLPKSHYYNQRV